jgi:hypothetical protein
MNPATQTTTKPTTMNVTDDAALDSAYDQGSSTPHQSIMMSLRTKPLSSFG